MGRGVKNCLTGGPGAVYVGRVMNGWLDLLLLSGALRGRGAAAGF